MLLLIFLFGSCVINALSRFISQQVWLIKLQLLVKEYSPLPWHEPSIPFYRGPWKLHRSTPEISTLSPIPLSPHCQHKAARWVIASLPNSSWVLVSEGEFVGSGDLRPMNGYPIPHRGQYASYILRRWRPAFLRPKGEIEICHRADEQNALFPQ
jgi:hypothetical protein